MNIKIEKEKIFEEIIESEAQLMISEYHYKLFGDFTDENHYLFSLEVSEHIEDLWESYHSLLQIELDDEGKDISNDVIIPILEISKKDSLQKARLQCAKIMETSDKLMELINGKSPTDIIKIKDMDTFIDFIKKHPDIQECYNSLVCQLKK